ncbi:BA3454 family stress response protein [Bacillus sp. RG28]|uniref:BA3454 family stress response protein n=1 Tax=Gottfriedia endophytica TaxID=2820819 RepID=A0A940SH15_9BACI|nr:BA3454 family stress response protein [Gottfriedia endophytica]MBP0725702.1 BA3454 family stress response protein [Gottfriedia endophytica]
MVEVEVTINYNGKNYKTNVLVNRGATRDEVYKLALDQIKKQWNLN